MTPAYLCAHGYAAPHCLRCHRPQPRQAIPLGRPCERWYLAWEDPPEVSRPSPLPTKEERT